MPFDDQLVALLDGARRRRAVRHGELRRVSGTRYLVGGRGSRGRTLILGAVLRHEGVAGEHPADFGLLERLRVALVALLGKVVEGVVLVENGRRQHQTAVLTGRLRDVKRLAYARDVADNRRARNGCGLARLFVGLF